MAATGTKIRSPAQISTGISSAIDQVVRAARELVETEKFVEVLLDAPAEVCETRDPRCHCAEARRREPVNVTGIESTLRATGRTGPAHQLDASHLRRGYRSDPLVPAGRPS